MIKGLNGDALAVAAAAATLGLLLWYHEHHFQRLTAWLLAVAAGFLVVAIPVWEGALGSLLLTGGGITVLVVLCMIVFPTFHMAAIRSGKPGRFAGLLGGRKKGAGPQGSGPGVLAQRAPKRNRYHRIGTPVTSILAGTLIVVVFGGWRLITAAAGKAGTGAVQALMHSPSQIASGHATAAVAASHRTSILIAGVFGLILLIAVMRGVDGKRKKGSGNTRRSGSPVPRRAG